MNPRRARRTGRQIPADLMLLSALSLSLIFGMPIAGVLRFHFPLVNQWVWFFVGTGAGFLVLVVLYRALEWTVNWLMRKR